jgi:VWFA-related protein
MSNSIHKWVSIFPLLGLLCVLSFLSFRSVAQEAPPPTPGVVRINVNLVQVDAVVTDQNGKPVTDLKAEDFELLQDGKVQKIRNFEFIRVRDTLAGMTVRPPAVRSGTDSTAPPAPALSTTLRPEQIRRTVALVVDDIALSYNGIVHVRDALKKWVNTEMQPGDLVSVVRTNAATGALQQFTGDKRVLFAAIERLKYQPGRIGVESFPAFTAAPDPEDIPIAETGFSAAVEDAYLGGSLNAIRYVMQGLRDLPGRKSLILFSEDLSLTALDTQRQPIEERLRRLTDEANRSSVVVYAIDPRGLLYTGPTASDNLGNRTGSQIADTIAGRASQYIDSQDGMVLLSQRTGGLFFSNINDLSVQLSKAINDGDGYYLMGYQPEQSTFEAKSTTAKYHSITLRVKRPGLKVRSRTGFYGANDTRVATAVSPNPQAQLAKALVSPFTTADLAVRLTTLFANSDKDGSYLKAMLHFDARDLTFTDQPDGTHSAMVDIAAVAFDQNGDAAETVNKTWSIRLRNEAYDEVLRKGLVYSVPLPVKRAGAYQLRIALRDDTSQKVGSAMQFVEVPDVKNGRLALSGIVISADPPVPDDPEGTPAVRIFRSGGAFSYAYEILNVPVIEKERASLASQIRLYSDGQLVFEGPSSLLNISGGDAKRLAVGGRMQLTKIPAGDYVLQVAVFDSVRKDKSRIAAQAIDFEVRP